MHVCVCPQAIKTIHVIYSLTNHCNQTNPTTFQFLYMTLAIDITNGCGFSNKVCRELLLKNSRVMLYLLFSIH